MIKDNHIVYTVKTLFRGTVSLRDYQVLDAVTKNLPVRIEMEKSSLYMIVPVNQLTEGRIGDRIFGYDTGRSYKLVAFDWNPLDANQLSIDLETEETKNTEIKIHTDFTVEKYSSENSNSIVIKINTDKPLTSDFYTNLNRIIDNDINNKF